MADISLWTVMGILAAAAFVQSATGFGLALVCMACLPLVMSIRDAATVTAILNLVVCAGVILWNRQGFSLRDCWPLMIAICVGIPIGYYGLRAFNDTWVVRILGVTLIGIAASELFFRRNDLAMPRGLGIPICVGGGILGGAFNVGGPPIVAYAYSQDWGKVKTVALLQTIFLASGLVRNGLMWVEGDTTFDLLNLVLVSIPAVFVAIWLGKVVLERTPLPWLKRIVFYSVLGIGIYYVWGSIRN